MSDDTLLHLLRYPSPDQLGLEAIPQGVRDDTFILRHDADMHQMSPPCIKL